MAKPFTVAWCLLAIAVASSVWAAWFAFHWSTELRQANAALVSSNQSAKGFNDQNARDLKSNQEAADRVSSFLRAWEPFLNPMADKKDRQVAILNALQEEAIQIQDLQVGTRVTPESKLYRFGDQTIDVEQVQMDVSGPLAKALVFLGRAEELFPYARLKKWSLEPTESGKTIKLTCVLVQPVKALPKNAYSK